MADEISKDKPTWGGARRGAGRPRGSMNLATKERLAIKRAFQDRVYANADRLFNSQFNMAIGEQYLMWKHEVGNGAKRRTVVEVVDDLETIKAYLDETLDTNGDFYFISTKPANGMAIDSLLDRAFGRADQKLEIDAEVEVTHIYKPEKLQQLTDINNQGHALQERAERAVEGQIADAMDSTTGTADVRPTNT